MRKLVAVVFLATIIGSFSILTDNKAHAYSTLQQEANGSFSGLCDDRSVSFSGNRDGNGYAVSASKGNGISSARGSNRASVIDNACQQASSSQELVQIPRGTIVVFDRQRAADLASARPAFMMTQSRVVNLGGDDETVVTRSDGRYYGVRFYSNVQVPYWELRDGTGEVFFAFIP